MSQLKRIDYDNIDNAAITIREWCQNNIHPFSDPELIHLQPEFTWDMHWINLWNSGSGMFSVRKFMYEFQFDSSPIMSPFGLPSKIRKFIVLS